MGGLQLGRRRAAPQWRLEHGRARKVFQGHRNLFASSNELHACNHRAGSDIRVRHVVHFARIPMVNLAFRTNGSRWLSRTRVLPPGEIRDTTSSRAWRIQTMKFACFAAAAAAALFALPAAA